ncbi:uncharacterized protein DUF3316 [Vibrio crassostreae]|uniref:DUF3316 domain-containing protein n=1 Tax=Vibrio pomeroyi TaxID=198832 RepID=A0ABV4MU54_9VIBR|nr:MULTISPECIES: DUF3316 domain-containing protein [Vibrio]MDD1824886.1 DUF3316 domain-containing protein [Photobacterium sp. ZSDE20]MCG9545986.1 DUF3316 domain-containing protein [Vibrio sp. Isolate33]OMO34125.1 acyl-CoA synthetase [Vibrio sp. 10N.261.45.E1]PMJ21139.1 acyl-CoA synthetase [Vibrio sp. 10N.286.45.B6]PML84071.1 acyl-CoA synthetase [Vibrio sp. 10N.261.49.E11]
MKKLIILASTLVLSTTAFAATKTTIQETTLKSDTFVTEAEAYDAGTNLMDELSAKTPFELSRELPQFQQTTKYDSFKIDDANMEVKKITNMNGDVHYQANVKVDYRYTYKDGRSS